MNYHPDVLAAHAEFGGDLQVMQALYDRPDYIARIAALEAQLAEQRTVPDAIAFIQKRLDDYVQEVGHTDPETGTVEFPDDGEYAGELEEIIDALSALEATPLAPKVTEGMVDAAERTMAAHYERPLKAWELTALHEALTAAQEAGK